MAAGLGFKDFTTGEVLTAADVDGYLMQNIWVFATATARDAAVTSPQEGNFAFTKDNNSLWYYDGAAWVASGATGDIEGVTAGIGISGGGTSGTVTVTNSMATAIDAKGDLVAGTGADTFAKLTVGANNTVLTADSTTATGLKWAAAGGGGANWTLLNSGGTALTGAQKITVSGISGKDKVAVFVKDAKSGTASSFFSVTFNDDTSTANYLQIANIYFNPPTYNQNQFPASPLADGLIYLSRNNVYAPTTTHGSIIATGCNASGAKIFTSSGGHEASDADGRQYMGQGYYLGSSTITEINVKSSAGNFNGGTVYVYTSA